MTERRAWAAKAAYLDILLQEKMPSGFMMQPTDSEHGVPRELQNRGEGSSQRDRRGANEASVISDLKVPSERCESIGWDDKSGP